MAQKVFNRIEKKFLLSEQQYQAFLEDLLQEMEIDEYGLHTIRNIYFDTENQELIRTSIEKPVYKEKFRIRCYGQPTEDSTIFLEIKKKYKGLVNKRRIAMKRNEAMNYLLAGVKPSDQSQIAKEIDYFIHHYNLRPEMYLAYDRIALFGKQDSEFRVTFDKNIRSRRTNLFLDDDTNTTMLLEDGYRLMEVKIPEAMPFWFLNLLEKHEIRQVSFSKYGNFYLNHVALGDYTYGVATDKSIGIDSQAYQNRVLDGILVTI